MKTLNVILYFFHARSTHYMDRCITFVMITISIIKPSFCDITQLRFNESPISNLFQ